MNKIIIIISILFIFTPSVFARKTDVNKVEKQQRVIVETDIDETLEKSKTRVNIGQTILDTRTTTIEQLRHSLSIVKSEIKKLNTQKTEIETLITEIDTFLGP